MCMKQVSFATTGKIKGEIKTHGSVYVVPQLFWIFDRGGNGIDHFESVNFAYSYNLNAKVILICGGTAVYKARTNYGD